MTWYHITGGGEVRVGWRLALTLVLFKDKGVHRGYNYDVWESGVGNSHGVHGREVSSTTTTSTGGGYQPLPPLLEASKSRMTLTATKN